MSGKSAPKPTDPKVTAAAQTGTNLSTAVGNAWLQNMNEVGPDGSKTFNQSGMQTVTDPYTGQSYQIPQFTVTTQLSEAQQAIKGQQDAASLNLATLGNNLSGQLGGQLTQNFQLGNEATEARLFDLGSKRLDPMFARQDEALRTRLANQGIVAGTEAYDREMGTLGQAKNDAYNQLLLTGRGQAAQESLAEDNQRINQISALLGGGQVSSPQFMTGAGVTAMPTVDTAGLIAQSDAQRLAAWQQRQANIGGALGAVGGLFSGGSTSAISGLMGMGGKHASISIGGRN